MGKATGSWGRQDVEWRAHFCCWAAWTVRHKDGDFVECDVNRGGLSRPVMHYIDFETLGKQFWLLDTYEGLVECLISEEEHRLDILPGGYSPCYEEVIKTFGSIPGVNIVKGVIPDTLAAGEIRSDLYLSIDMNNAAPEIAAAEYFGGRMVSGGIIVLDDYGLRKQINQKIVIADRAGNRYQTLDQLSQWNRRGGRTMTNPWLSVVMPCRNGERWLAEALQSVVEQHEPGIEVVFIDGSDSEASMKIAESFAGRLALSIHRRPDLGSWIAKTGFGVQEARADWITMLHVDDLWLPGRGAALRCWLAARSNAVMHLHPAYFIDGQGKRLGIWRCPLPAGEAAVPGELLLERLLVQNFIAVPATAIRRDAFLHVGGLDESLWHTADWDLYLKLAAVGTVHYHPEPLACFRIHGNSLTMTGSRSLEDYRNQLETVFERHSDKLKPGKERRVRRLSAASININTALAAANVGRPDALAKALRSLLRLGPCGIQKYLYYSRIIERALPRLRARLAGRM